MQVTSGHVSVSLRVICEDNTWRWHLRCHLSKHMDDTWVSMNSDTWDSESVTSELASAMVSSQ